MHKILNFIYCWNITWVISHIISIINSQFHSYREGIVIFVYHFVIFLSFVFVYFIWIVSQNGSYRDLLTDICCDTGFYDSSYHWFVRWISRFSSTSFLFSFFFYEKQVQPNTPLVTRLFYNLPWLQNLLENHTV